MQPYSGQGCRGLLNVIALFGVHRYHPEMERRGECPLFFRRNDTGRARCITERRVPRQAALALKITESRTGAAL